MSNSSMPCLDSLDAVSQVIAWARQAGQIALRYSRDAVPRRKPDQSFLTQADLEIEDFLAERIRSTFPDHGLISEEGARDQNNRSAAYLWVVDPLDGTTAFVQGLTGWGISIGLLYQRQPCFGLFYMPTLDDMTCTIDSNGVSRNGSSLHQTVRSDWGPKGFLAINASAHHDFQIDVQRTRTLGSVGANLVYTARGAAAAAFIPKARLWDLVAGAAIVTRAGGELRYLSGRAIDYMALLDGRLAPEPVIAGHPNLLAELPSLIRPRLHSGF
jgi:fructose-1,6-bisphosphatase/inositol monophosphatase family enzyme